MQKKNLWLSIYQLAEQLYRLSPWKWLYETEVFGIRSPETSRTYFISILGNSDIEYALIAYEGTTALGQFWEFQSRHANLPSEFILTIPHIMLSFVEADMLPDDQKKQIEKSGIAFNHNALPLLTRCVPGFVPASPDIESLNDFNIIFEQALHVLNRTKQDAYFLHTEEQTDDDYLVRKTFKTGNQIYWEDAHERITIGSQFYEIKFPKETLTSYIHLSKVKDIYQVDARLLFNPVRDGEHPDYYPFLLMVVHKKSGMVAGFQLLQPLTGFEKMLSSIPREFMKIFIQAGQRPYSIEVTNNSIYNILKKVSSKLDLNVTLVKKLTQYDEAYNSFADHINSMK